MTCRCRCARLPRRRLRDRQGILSGLLRDRVRTRRPHPRLPTSRVLSTRVSCATSSAETTAQCNYVLSKVVENPHRFDRVTFFYLVHAKLLLHKVPGSAFFSLNPHFTLFWALPYKRHPESAFNSVAPKQRSSSTNKHGVDTTTAHGRLMLAVLGGLAEFERELIAARTGEGRERAKARGVKMGGSRNSPPTSSARRSGGATARASRCARLPGPTCFSLDDFTVVTLCH
jgi:hypothetical protein